MLRDLGIEDWGIILLKIIIMVSIQNECNDYQTNNLHKQNKQK